MTLPPLVSRYAERFALLGGDEHRVGSPLGAWLVLAIAAPAAHGALRAEIVDVLGTDVDSAHRLAGALLERSHPAVAAALATLVPPSRHRTA